VIGAIEGTLFYSLADPSNPEFIHFIRGANSTWRDMKHQGEYVYVVTDSGSDGLTIVNMSGAPDNISHTQWKPEIIVGNDTTTLRKCHNLYIDENGICYLSGCNPGNRGVLMLDIVSNPMSPSLLGFTNQQYSHDAYARGDTLWSSDIFAGEFTVWDVSDKSAPELLAEQTTTTVFTHNSWLSDDGRYLFTTDEKIGAGVDSYDVSDLSDIRLLDTYRPGAAVGRNILPHNAHYYNGYLVISHYSEGVKIVDVHEPDKMIEVGSYDTSPDFNSGGAGNWGATPFSPRNLLLASDRQRGLYVLQPNYVRASYLLGQVTDEDSGEAIDDVEIIISGSEHSRTFSDAFGNYNSGIPVSGSVDVIFTKFGYDTLEVSVDLLEATETVLNVQMTRSPLFVISGKVVSAATGNPIAGALVEVENDYAYHNTVTGSDGEFLVEDVISYPEYSIEVGIWGHHEMKHDISVLGHLVLSTMTLDRGYKDDFILDLGWETSADDDSHFQRKYPIKSV
jgi:choice-of-anchor B domain-containing protein